MKMIIKFIYSLSFFIPSIVECIYILCFLRAIFLLHDFLVKRYVDIFIDIQSSIQNGGLLKLMCFKNFCTV